MNIEELVDSHGVTLAYFDNELWHRPGIYIKDINIIFIIVSCLRTPKNGSYTTN